MKKASFKKILGFVTAALIFFGLSANFNTAYADFQPGGGNNTVVHNGLIANFKYEKTIDMTNMKDRSKIPNADFNFVISTIDEDKEEAYHIGKHYENEDTGYSRTILPGKFEEGAESTSKLFSSVSFKETDGFDPEFTRLMDARDNGKLLITHILKYDWGEMRSSDRIQTAISRQPVGDELAYWDDPTVATWPEDTIVWRCFSQPDNDWYEKFLEDPINNRVGSFEDACQLVNEYDFETFDYVTKFNLNLNPYTIYYAYSYKKPLLTHQSKDNAGNYTSVSKGLLTAEKYEEWLWNFIEWNIPEGVDSPVYRYLLTEEPTADSVFAENKEVKFVDYFPGNEIFLIFNSLDEADAFYTHIVNNDIVFGRFSVLNEDFIPNASFTNRPAPAPKPDPKPEPSPEPDPTPEPNEPPKHDLRYARDDFYEEKKPEVIIIHKESILPKTGDSLNLPLYVGALGFLLLSAGVLKLRRNN
ncbi:MAG: LPXTG cell wall anchor domain-containing protein [Coriobacteriia bacterium]|nr:LPXTG cell wall anchor domain-containing protein [Coriobacteriia bacterium]